MCTYVNVQVRVQMWMRKKNDSHKNCGCSSFCFTFFLPVVLQPKMIALRPINVGAYVSIYANTDHTSECHA